MLQLKRLYLRLKEKELLKKLQHFIYGYSWVWIYNYLPAYIIYIILFTLIRIPTFIICFILSALIDGFRQGIEDSGIKNKHIPF